MPQTQSHTYSGDNLKRIELDGAIPLESKSDLPAIPAIYFALVFHSADNAMKGNCTVLYIGRSKNINQRWLYHDKMEQLQSLDDDVVIGWAEFEESRLIDIERDLIKNFAPKLNRHAPRVFQGRYRKKYNRLLKRYGEAPKPLPWIAYATIDLHATGNQDEAA